MDQLGHCATIGDVANDAGFQDLVDRVRPVVEQVLLEPGMLSGAGQLDLLVVRLATELHRDLGVG